MSVVISAIQSVWVTFTHSWLLLLVSAVVGTALKLYVDQKKVAAFLKRHERAGIAGATAVAVTTPLCSCGTMAVVLGMMASFVSWAPIVAFMVASPLSSPQELFYSAGLFGWHFAWFYYAASIALGLLGGAVALFAERRGWLANQSRFRDEVAAAAEPEPTACGCATRRAGAVDRLMKELPVFAPEFARQTIRLLVMFLGFAFIGYLLNGLIPSSVVSALFGKGRVYGVPLAATLGLPLYVSSEASLPLVRSFLDLGMSPGATLAFLLTGAGTSAGAIAGALTIAKARVIAIVIGTLWAGAIIAGFAYNALIAVGLF